jgi:hypothetical protein
MKSKAYAYLYHANVLGNDVAKNYMDKLALKMDKSDFINVNKIIKAREWGEPINR